MCKLHKNSGFTLIEIMVSIAIIAIGIFAVMSLVITVMKGNTLSKRVTTATTIAQEQLEDFKRMDYDNIDVGVDAYSTDTATTYDVPYYREVIVTPDGTIDIKTIEVKVYWDPAAISSTHNVELETIIAQ